MLHSPDADLRVETNDGAVINPVRWYTFTMNHLDGPQDIPANATINTTKFILNDNEALVVGRSSHRSSRLSCGSTPRAALAKSRQTGKWSVENRRRLQHGAWHAADADVPADNMA
jgi:hypothetical protein